MYSLFADTDKEMKFYVLFAAIVAISLAHDPLSDEVRKKIKNHQYFYVVI